MKFDYQEANERFLQLETDLNLFDYYVDNMLIWERIRNLVADQLMADLGLAGTPNDISGNDQTSSLDMKTCIRNSVKKNPFFSNSNADIFFYSHGRRKILDDGYWWDLVIDPIAAKIKRTSICIENYGDSSHPTPAKTPNLYYKDFISCSTGIGKRFNQYLRNINNRRLNKIRMVERELKAVFGVDISLVSIVKKELVADRIRYRLYKSLISRIDPEVVVVWTRPHSLISAAQSLDIPVVELQHGMISQYNYDYNFPGKREAQIFPDYLFTFGTYWNKAVDYPVSQDRIVATGYPYTEMMLEQYQEQSKNENRIIIPSQPYVGEKLSKFAVKFKNIADEYEIMYKLHPREYQNWEQQYPWLKETDITVIDSDEPGLYELLASAEIQIGVSTTVLYEGVLFGLETYLVDLPKSSTMGYFHQQGVPVVESPEELLNAMDRSEGFAPDVGPLFAANPTQTTIDALLNIVDAP